ncbi:MAG: ADP-ribosylglycohydrolase family protein [Verrucomicrobiota bacterium]
MKRAHSLPADDAIAGVLIGTAVGDALGLPMEGLSAGRQRRLFPGALRHRLLGRWGMISDDTEHTLMLAQALLAHPNDAAAFQRCFAWKLRWWLVSLPAGVGFATLRAILKLWIGIPPQKSGIFSAGNGPSMRSALLGVYFAESPEQRRRFVSASTRLTHCDPRAEVAALAVAETASWMAQRSNDAGDLLKLLQNLSQDPEWQGLVQRLHSSFDQKETVSEFARTIGCLHGVSGYAFRTVPVAIYAALMHQNDFPAALTSVIACGGDTDTVAAITGALVGARLGVGAIPDAWTTGIRDWPRSPDLARRIAARLYEQQHLQAGPVRYFWPAIPLRNLIFLGVVLIHGLRRLFPPY